MTPMARPLALLAALALVPACDNDDDQELFIQNSGSVSVVVQITHEDSSGDEDTDYFEIPAGSSYLRDYDGDIDVDVVITRKSDGLLLYSASFDPDDFEDDNGTIEIVVVP